MILEDLAEFHRGIVGVQNLEEADTLFPEGQEFNLVGDGLQTCSLHSFPGGFNVIHIHADMVDGTVIALGAIGFQTLIGFNADIMQLQESNLVGGQIAGGSRIIWNGLRRILTMRKKSACSI